MALVVTLLAMVFSAMSATIRQRSLDQQLLAVEGNLSGACAKIAEDVRSAGWPGYTGAPSSTPFIVRPVSHGVDNEMVVVLPSLDGKLYRVRYYVRAFGDHSCQIVREQAQVTSTCEPIVVDSGTLVEDPVTPRLTQIVRVLFANDGARVMITMVARITVNGYAREITYCDLVYPRNYGD